ncbi:MAG: M48 metallopeptidase family protein [Nitriliruptorales bacterium]
MSRHIEVEHRPATADRPALELRRSIRRRKTVSAYARDGTIVVQLPARLPPAVEERHIADLVARVTGRARAQAVESDQALAARAAVLADTYLDGVRPASISWSDRMERRNGSCTSLDRSIRISRRLAGCPDYVLDYVIVHELAHLLVPGHPREFHALVDRFPDADRAHGFLEGVAHAAHAPVLAPTADHPG